MREFLILTATRTGEVADVYVVYGQAGARADFTDTALDNPATAFHMTYDLSALANPATDPFDFSISSAGDQNGDGFGDIAIGTPDANNGDGGLTIVYGRADSGDLGSGQIHIAGITTPLQDVIANGQNQSLVGSANMNILQDSGFGGLSLRGGGGNDTFLLSNTAQRLFDGGAGFDTIELSGAGHLLDFSHTSAATALRGSESLSGIEKMIMQDNSQTIKLGLDDVFRLLQGSDDGTLRIDEGSGGISTSFVIDDNGAASGAFSSQATGLGFTANGTLNDGGTTYNVYDFGSGYQLLIDQNIETVAVV